MQRFFVPLVAGCLLALSLPASAAKGMSKFVREGVQNDVAQHFNRALKRKDLSEHNVELWVTKDRKRRNGISHTFSYSVTARKLHVTGTGWVISGSPHQGVVDKVKIH